MNDSSRAVSRDRFSLEHQIAVVTGACGKLGPVWVEALLDAGARVAALELPGAPRVRRRFRARWKRARRCRSSGSIATSRTAQSIESAAAAVATRMGSATVLVNNAGVDQPPDSGGNRSTYRRPADRTVPADARRQPDRHLPGHAGVRRADGDAGQRLDHQHRIAVRVGLARPAFLRSLCRAISRFSSLPLTAHRRRRS